MPKTIPPSWLTERFHTVFEQSGPHAASVVSLFDSYLRDQLRYGLRPDLYSHAAPTG